MKRNSKKIFNGIELKPDKKGSFYLLDTSKYKSGKKKGQYKYLIMKGLPIWTDKKNVTRTDKHNSLDNK